MVCAVIASTVRRGILRYLPRRNIPLTDHCYRADKKKRKRKNKDLLYRKNSASSLSKDLLERLD